MSEHINGATGEPRIDAVGISPERKITEYKVDRIPENFVEENCSAGDGRFYVSPQATHVGFVLENGDTYVLPKKELEFHLSSDFGRFLFLSLGRLKDSENNLYVKPIMSLGIDPVEGVKIFSIDRNTSNQNDSNRIDVGLEAAGLIMYLQPLSEDMVQITITREGTKGNVRETGRSPEVAQSPGKLKTDLKVLLRQVQELGFKTIVARSDDERRMRVYRRMGMKDSDLGQGFLSADITELLQSSFFVK